MKLGFYMVPAFGLFSGGRFKNSFFAGFQSPVFRFYVTEKKLAYPLLKLPEYVTGFSI